jgi:hypothetical protein
VPRRSKHSLAEWGKHGPLDIPNQVPRRSKHLLAKWGKYGPQDIPDEVLKRSIFYYIFYTNKCRNGIWL